MSTPPAAWNASKIGDVVAELGELAGGGQPGRPGADDADRLAGLGRVARGVSWSPCWLGPVGDEALEAADGDRVALLAAEADALALALLRADPAGDAGQGVVVEERVGRGRQVALAQQLDEARDVDPDRAAVDAVRLRALEAALGLEHRQLVGEPEVDLAEVARPQVGVLLGHRDPGDGHPLLGGQHVRPVAGLGAAARLAGPARGLVRSLDGSAGRSVIAVLPSGLRPHRPTAVPALAGRVGRRDVARLALGEGRLLERAVGRQPVGQLGEVDQVGVELGPVDAGVARLAVDRHPAAAAHARAVDHDRVERDDGRDAVRPGRAPATARIIGTGPTA